MNYHIDGLLDNFSNVNIKKKIGQEVKAYLYD